MKSIGTDAEPIEVLLVEDSPGDDRLTREPFKDAKLHINLHVALDGAEAMDFLNREGTPHLRIERFFLMCPKELALRDPRTRSRSVQVNVGRLFHPKDKRARVLQSPLHVGNVEVDGQVPVVRREFNLRRDGDLMLGSVNDEHAMDLHV